MLIQFYHEEEADEHETSDFAAKHGGFSVGNQDNRQILEDCENGHRQMLERLAARIQHRRHHERHGHP